MPSPAYPEPSSPAASAVMRGNRRVDTAPERALRSELHRRGYRFRKDHPIALPGRRVRPDVVFTRQRVAVFVDGCFWHRCPEHGTEPRANSAYWGPKLDRNVERDREVDQLLKAEGWVVVRVWEHQPQPEAAGEVVAALQARESPDRKAAS